jgi:hypothetical protein
MGRRREGCQVVPAGHRRGLLTSNARAGERAGPGLREGIGCAGEALGIPATEVLEEGDLAEELHEAPASFGHGGLWSPRDSSGSSKASIWSRQIRSSSVSAKLASPRSGT